MSRSSGSITNLCSFLVYRDRMTRIQTAAYTDPRCAEETGGRRNNPDKGTTLTRGRSFCHPVVTLTRGRSFCHPVTCSSVAGAINVFRKSPVCCWWYGGGPNSEKRLLLWRYLVDGPSPLSLFLHTRICSCCYMLLWANPDKGTVLLSPCGKAFALQEQSLYSGKARSAAGGMQEG